MIRKLLSLIQSLLSGKGSGVDLNQQTGVVDGAEDLEDVEVKVKQPEPQPQPEPEPEPKVGITEAAFREAGAEISVEPAKIKAVDEVESRGQGFLDDGRPKILFEAHWFSKLTDGKYDDSHPDISSSTWDRSLYRGGKAEHYRIQRALDLDRQAALQSASWGRYQIMGFNWKKCDYAELQGFIDGMWESESEHLRAFVAFVRSEGLHVPLRDGDWEAFARGYNGPGYKKNNYHIRMREAYKKHKQ